MCARDKNVDRLLTQTKCIDTCVEIWGYCPWGREVDPEKQKAFRNKIKLQKKKSLVMQRQREELFCNFDVTLTLKDPGYQRTKYRPFRRRVYKFESSAPVSQQEDSIQKKDGSSSSTVHSLSSMKEEENWG
ncbi:uncharacterized protein [Watersipora subatra]|uniref:uncharacterized protein isoform X1 n=1 Tax=Watersipora subatra TaxID=2589382 RepID=UPI00355C87D9